MVLILSLEALDLLVANLVDCPKSQGYKQKMSSVSRPLHRLLSPDENELWFVQFSHNGKYLVSSGKGKHIVVWDVDRVTSGAPNESDRERFRFPWHEQTVCSPIWSPDDSRLLAAFPRTITVWNIDSGELLRSINTHPSWNTSCVWAPNGLSFFSGGTGGKLIEWNAESGETVWSHWINDPILDVAVSGNGHRIVAIDSNETITVIDLQSREVVRTMTDSMFLMSCTLARDNVSLLVTTTALCTSNPDTTAREVHEWNIETGVKTKNFKNYSQQLFIIRGCYGGLHEQCVLCGSEDSSVHVWSRETERLMLRFPGHSKTVNSVAWSPVDAQLFASASDDGSVLVSIRHKRPGINKIAFTNAVTFISPTLFAMQVWGTQPDSKEAQAMEDLVSSRTEEVSSSV